MAIIIVIVVGIVGPRATPVSLNTHDGWESGSTLGSLPSNICWDDGRPKHGSYGDYMGLYGVI